MAMNKTQHNRTEPNWTELNRMERWKTMPSTWRIASKHERKSKLNDLNFKWKQNFIDHPFYMYALCINRKLVWLVICVSVLSVFMCIWMWALCSFFKKKIVVLFINSFFFIDTKFCCIENQTKWNNQFLLLHIYMLLVWFFSLFRLIIARNISYRVYHFQWEASCCRRFIFNFIHIPFRVCVLEYTKCPKWREWFSQWHDQSGFILKLKKTSSSFASHHGNKRRREKVWKSKRKLMKCSLLQ